MKSKVIKGMDRRSEQRNHCGEPFSVPAPPEVRRFLRADSLLLCELRLKSTVDPQSGSKSRSRNFNG